MSNENPLRVIGLVGPSGVGKSTIAKMLYVCAEEQNCVIESFASAVKQIARTEYDWDGKKDKEGRELLQRIGSARRSENIDYFIKKMKMRLLYAFELHYQSHLSLDYIFIDDVRFANEAQYIRDAGGLLVKVESIRYPQMDGQDEWRKHESENEFKDIQTDFGFVNGMSGLGDLMVDVLQLWMNLDAEFKRKEKLAADKKNEIVKEIFKGFDGVGYA